MKTKMTQELLKTIKQYKEKSFSAQQTAEQLGISFYTVKHTYAYLFNDTEEVLQFILSNTDKSYGELDKLLNKDNGTIKNICLLHGITLKTKSLSYSEEEISVTKQYYSTKGLKYVADKLNISETRVRVLASKLKLKRDYQYSKEEEEKITQDFKNGSSPYDLSIRYNRTVHAIESFLSRRDLTQFNNPNSPYYISKPERYMIDYITTALNITVPDKTKEENRSYYYKIVGNYEIDLPLYINGYKFAIEYDGDRWHEETRDNIKTKALQDAGYIVMRISSKDHDNNFYKLNSLNKKLDEIIKAIKLITGSL